MPVTALRPALLVSSQRCSPEQWSQGSKEGIPASVAPGLCIAQQFQCRKQNWCNSLYVFHFKNM